MPVPRCAPVKAAGPGRQRPRSRSRSALPVLAAATALAGALCTGCASLQTLLARKPAADQNAPLLAGDLPDHAEIEQLRRALAAHPDDPRHFVDLARLLVAHGECGQAEDSLDAALRLDPADQEALLLKAVLLERQHRDADAAELYHRVLICDARNAEARLRLATLHAREGDLDRAAPLLRKVCQLAGATPAQRAEAHWQLGFAYGRQHRWHDAAAELAAALPLKPDPSADDWYRLAYAQLQAGNPASAGQAITVALRIDPQHDGALALASRTGNPAVPPPPLAIQFAQAEPPAPAGW